MSVKFGEGGEGLFEMFESLLAFLRNSPWNIVEIPIKW